MEELFQLVAKTWGIAGIILLTPTAGCVFLWRHYVAKEKEWRQAEKEWVKKLEDIHAKRVEDVKSLGEGLRAIAIEQSGLNKETNMALDRISETMSSLQAVISASSSRRG